jgi:hypothetical protein
MKRIASTRKYNLAKRAAVPPSSMNPQHERPDRPGWRGTASRPEGGVEPEVALQHQDTLEGRAELERLKQQLADLTARLDALEKR